MTLRRGSVAALVVVLMAVLVAGCGGRIDHHQYVQRADAICAFTLRSVRSLSPPDASGGEAALAAYLDRVVPLQRRELKQLSALPRPSEPAARSRRLDAYLAALRSSVTRFELLEQAARARQSATVSRLEAGLIDDPAPRLASAYGLGTCSSSAATYH